jgi:hypothetical protein
MNNNNSTMYALWYYIITGEKSTNIISLKEDSLLEFKKNLATSDKDSSYNKYKHLINKIKVEPILVYQYNDNSLTICNDITNLNSGNFYSSYDYYFPSEKKNNITYIDLREVLVYLSDLDHEKWRTCYLSNVNLNIFQKKVFPTFFYEAPISCNPVLPDFFYEEGILNA